MTGLPAAAAFFAAGLLFFTWWIITARRFDDALRDMYQSNRLLWENLGKPTGFFWQPDEKLKFFASTNARNELVFAFLFKRGPFRKK